MKISAAKDVVAMFESVKKAIHGKEPQFNLQIANINTKFDKEELANLSTDELRMMIAKESKDE